MEYEPATASTASVPRQCAASGLRALRWKHVCLILLLIGGTHFAYRVAIIGMPPFTDGGAYVCFGYFANSGEPSTPGYPINLYPALVSSAGVSDDAPFLRVRLIDALFCAISVSVTALLIYRLTSLGPAILLGLIWSTAWLHMSIGNAGMKNTIVPAFGLLSACLLLWTYRGRVPLLVAGALIPLIPLVREPMAITAVILLIACTLLQGRRGLAISLTGGVVSGSVLLGWVWLFRGSPYEILAAYRDVSTMFSELAATYTSRSAAITESLPDGLQAGRGLVLAGLTGGIVLAVVTVWKRELRDQRLLLIALLLFAFPLIEILAKIPFPYHWIQMGMGPILLACLGYRALGGVMSAQARLRGMALGNIALAAILYAHLAGNQDTLEVSIAQSKYFESVMVEGNWEHDSVSESFYLRTAKFIRDNTKDDDAVFVSGFYYVLYPLSQRFPPDTCFHDATFASLAGLHEKRRTDVDTAFTARAPQLVVESLRWDDTGERIREFVRGFPENYDLVAELPTDLPIHYGHFGARIWELRDEADVSRGARASATEQANVKFR